MLTKKDYKALAEMIASANRPFTVPIWQDAHIKNLADWLQTTNPRFDREKFITACEGNPNPQE